MNLWVFLIIAQLIIVQFMVVSESDGQQSQKVPVDEPSKLQCGQYGFRCIDKKAFEICAIPDEDGVTDKPEVHECKEDLVCDEDNPAYCTPADPLMSKDFSNDNNNDENNIHNFYDYFEENHYENKREETKGTECPTEPPNCHTTTTESPDSTSTSYFTTWASPTDPPEFNCETYGFFPDSFNTSFFWYCDVPDSGKGFITKHMICGEDRIFDTENRACVLIGTTPRIRNTNMQLEELNYEPITKSTTKLNRETSKKLFSCKGRPTGKYSDNLNCRYYHVCVDEKFSPIKELLFVCPERTAYDPIVKRCSKSAIYRCFIQDNPNQDKLLCNIPNRFREVSNCKEYYLCVGNKTFKVKCPRKYRFDDDSLECLPKEFAKCVEENI